MLEEADGGGSPIPVPEGANGEKLAAMVNEAIRIANDDSYYYLWGGTGPLGYDCSGLISVLYNKYLGVDTGRTSAAMHSRLQGNKVSMSSLKAGDILWKKGHVALYIGGGQIVEAYSSKVPKSEQIRVTGLAPGRFTEAYRIIP